MGVLFHLLVHPVIFSLNLEYQHQNIITSLNYRWEVTWVIIITISRGQLALWDLVQWLLAIIKIKSFKTTSICQHELNSIVRLWFWCYNPLSLCLTLRSLSCIQQISISSVLLKTACWVLGLFQTQTTTHFRAWPVKAHRRGAIDLGQPLLCQAWASTDETWQFSYRGTKFLNYVVIPLDFWKSFPSPIYAHRKWGNWLFWRLMRVLLGN